MTLRAMLLPLLLLGTLLAQDSAPLPLSGKDRVPICRGDASDAASCVAPPQATYMPDPKFPKKERKARHQGTVILGLVVGSDGLPRDIKVSRALSPEFDEAAVDAVKKWKFSPSTKDGKPVAVQISVEVAFRLY